MAAKLPLEIHDAFYRVVHDYPDGVAALAVKMGVTPKILYNKADPDSEGNNKPTLADCVVATLITNDKRILHAFSHAVGSVCFQLPDMTTLTTDALMLHLLKIQHESGDFHKALRDALATNDQINKQEYAVIQRQGFEWIAAILEGMARMREMSEVADE